MKKVLFVALITITSGASAAETTVPTSTQWEQVLTSSQQYANPFADVFVTVEYHGPNGESFSAGGFWDGEAVFKIRAMFPTPGRWTWRTTCTDPANAGLHQQAGAVQVTPYAGDNLLRRRGYLKVVPGQHYISYGDGTPFLWVGDTAWAAPMNASFDHWQAYVRDRRQKRFTVIQMFCASAWAGTKDVLGNEPFVGEGLSQWNPAYWREYEKKVHHANDQAMVVVVMGLMEPVKRYPEAAAAQLFARQLAARLAGSFVIFSPSFDSKYMELADAVAETVRQAVPRHLMTQHPGTGTGASKIYHGKPELDFVGLQTGAGWGSKPPSAAAASRAAIEWSRQLYQLQPPKPVINLEARYDSAFNQTQLPRLPRSCGYWTMLSGASGYTYGCGGLWNWGRIRMGDDPQATPWEWQIGLNQPSSTEMKYLADFFGSIPWWRLEPCPELIRDQPEDWTLRMTMAKTAAGDLAVVYLPDNPSVHLDMKPFPTAMQTRWHNPRTGAQLPGESIKNEGEGTFSRPDGWEDALLVLFAGGASPNAN